MYRDGERGSRRSRTRTARAWWPNPTRHHGQRHLLVSVPIDGVGSAFDDAAGCCDIAASTSNDEM